MPVLMVAAYDENGKVNVMNAAWGMISDMKQITLFLSEDHKTTANILATKAFTVVMECELGQVEGTAGSGVVQIITIRYYRGRSLSSNADWTSRKTGSAPDILLFIVCRVFCIMNNT